MAKQALYLEKYRGQRHHPPGAVMVPRLYLITVVFSLRSLQSIRTWADHLTRKPSCILCP
jgi:hypothetical protein